MCAVLVFVRVTPRLLLQDNVSVEVESLVANAVVKVVEVVVVGEKYLPVWLPVCSVVVPVVNGE